MSWWCNLCDPVTKETIVFEFKHEMRGGTYALGGTNEASLNVTYNYGKHFDFNKLDGLTGAEAIDILNITKNRLKDDVDDDYWKSTEGNVKRAVLSIIALSQLRPDGVWRIS